MKDPWEASADMPDQIYDTNKTHKGVGRLRIWICRWAVSYSCHIQQAYAAAKQMPSRGDKRYYLFKIQQKQS